MRTWQAFVFPCALLLSMVGHHERVAYGDDQANVAQLLKEVNATALLLEKDISAVLTALNDIPNGPADSAKVLDDVQSLIERVHERLAEESAIWVELARVTGVWDGNYRDALNKSETSPAYDDVAREWSNRIKQAAGLRNQILTQRAESRAMLDQLLHSREVIMHYYQIGLADKALETLKAVKQNLVSMTESMQAIVDQTRVVANERIPQ